MRGDVDLGNVILQAGWGNLLQGFVQLDQVATTGLRWKLYRVESKEDFELGDEKRIGSWKRLLLLINYF